MAVGTTAFPTSLDTVVELVELKNNASSTLSGNVLIGDVTIGVTDIAEFPTTGFGTLTDDLTTPTKTEIISWTGISGSNLTGCTRGTQGTSAAAFSSGNYIEVRPTAGHHEALRGAVIAIETKLGTGSTIAVNKLAALTASRAVVTDASGFLASATVTAAELGYLANVTTPTGSGALVLATSPTLSAPSIAKLANLTSNGFVKTSSSDGTLSVDTSTYLTANQSITLSGDVTGSGSTAITTTIAGASVTYAKIQDISATSRILGRKTAAAGSTEECTLSDVLDFVGSAAQGDILYRGASGWARLGAGTNGYYLQTQGAAANPQWAAAAGGGLTIGTTAITSGTAGRILYETSGNVVGEIAGFTYQPAASPNLTITAQAASYVGLRINSAATPSVNIFETTVNGGAGTGFVVTSTGAPSSPGAGSNSERYGATSLAAGANATAFGYGASASNTRNTAIGNTAVASSTSDGIAIGYNARVSGAESFSVGTNTNVTAANVVGIGGSNLTVSGTTQIVLYTGGTGITFSGQQAVYIGNFSASQSQNSVIALGTGSPTAANQFVASVSGSSNNGIENVFFGKGVTHATPTAYAINGTGGSGSNIAGANINIAGGKGTGTGIPGTIGMQFARAGSTGSSLNTLSDEWRASYSTTDTVTLGANIKTSTTTLTSAATISALWTTATHASRTSALTLSTVDNAASLAERWRLSTNGAGTGVSTTTTGFFGGTNVTGMLAESITLNTGGTTTDSTIDLPANSIILSVTGRVTTTITTATDWKLGDATISDRFSDANATLTAGTTTVGINQWKADRTTAGQGAFQQSTAKVRITTTGTPGAGVIRITIHYITLSAPTS